LNTFRLIVDLEILPTENFSTSSYFPSRLRSSAQGKSFDCISSPSNFQYAVYTYFCRAFLTIQQSKARGIMLFTIKRKTVTFIKNATSSKGPNIINQYEFWTITTSTSLGLALQMIIFRIFLSEVLGPSVAMIFFLGQIMTKK
jgi:hypothetical protein